MESYDIRLPDGSTIERELPKEEVEYWISVGMYLAHGFHQLTTVFAAEQMDDAANVELPEEGEEGPTVN